MSPDVVFQFEFFKQIDSSIVTLNLERIGAL